MENKLHLLPGKMKELYPQFESFKKRASDTFVSITEKMEFKFHEINKKKNKYMNRFGIYYFENVYFDLNKINKELEDVINSELIRIVTKPGNQKYIFVLDGHEESNNLNLSHKELRMFENLVKELPVYKALEEEINKRNFEPSVNYIHSSENEIFKGLYVRFNERK